MYLNLLTCNFININVFRECVGLISILMFSILLLQAVHRGKSPMLSRISIPSPRQQVYTVVKCRESIYEICFVIIVF